jgi:hypothetical protein
LGASRCHPVAPTIAARRDMSTGVTLSIGLAIVLASSPPLRAKEYRSSAVTSELQREHPCPSTTTTVGGCPGYRTDHVVPLACGGPDGVSNMQWQTAAAAREKDRYERKAYGRVTAAETCSPKFGIKRLRLSALSRQYHAHLPVAAC